MFASLRQPGERSRVANIFIDQASNEIILIKRRLMKIAIMQPYFFPYIGYFQLINLVDKFIVYDNIEFTKKGWINRNRILVHGQDSYITLPLKKDSDYLEVRDRSLADNWYTERKSLLNRISGAYRNAPYFELVFPLIEKCVLIQDRNLFRFIFNSLIVVNEYLQIKTPLVVSSTIPIDHDLKAEKKVLALCKAMGATDYINPIGGVKLYQKDEFRSEGIDLYFIKSADVMYQQFDHAFVPYLSIVDVMMFNSSDEIRLYLASSFTLV